MYSTRDICSYIIFIIKSCSLPVADDLRGVGGKEEG